MSRRASKSVRKVSMPTCTCSTLARYEERLYAISFFFARSNVFGWAFKLPQPRSRHGDLMDPPPRTNCITIPDDRPGYPPNVAARTPPCVFSFNRANCEPRFGAFPHTHTPYTRGRELILDGTIARPLTSFIARHTHTFIPTLDIIFNPK